jgi:hypothetical protein
MASLEPFTTLCSVYARMHRGSIEDYGVLSIIQVSSVIAVMRFEGKEISSSYDIDDMTLNEEKLSIYIYSDDTDSSVVKLDDSGDFSTIQSSLAVSREVCELTLKLRAISRDFYFSGTYQSVPTNSDVHFAPLIKNLPLLTEDSVAKDFTAETESIKVSFSTSAPWQPLIVQSIALITPRTHRCCSCSYRIV